MKFWSITKHVYRNNVKSWGFVLMVLSPLLFLGVSLFIGVYSPSPSDSTIAIVADREDIRESFIEDALPWSLNTSIRTKAEAENALIDEEISGFIMIKTIDMLSTTLVQTDGLFDDYQPMINDRLNRSYLAVESQAMGLSENIQDQLQQKVESNVQQVRVENGHIIAGNVAEYRLQQNLLVFAGSALFFLLINYASSILSEISSEKGTRMMEIILSATQARTHLLGKLVGILLAILTQFVIYAVPIIIGIGQVPAHTYKTLFGTEKIMETINPVLIPIVAFSLVGLVTYVLLAALLGSLASRQEDASKLGIPLTIFTFIGYTGSISLANGSSNPVFSVLSYIPLFSPQLMPLRLFHDQVSPLIAIWTFVGCVVFAGMVFFVTIYTYKSNVLAYSKTSITQTIKQSWMLIKENRKR